MLEEDGGAAFPTPDCSAWDGPSRTPGMTLRDWFAGQALAGIFASGNVTLPFNGPEEAAARAYQFADAMLKARA
jgi:hypothetical protein